MDRAEQIKVHLNKMKEGKIKMHALGLSEALREHGILSHVLRIVQ